MGAVAGFVLDLAVMAYGLTARLAPGEAADVMAVLVLVTFGSPLVAALVYLRMRRGALSYVAVVCGALLVVLLAGALIGR